VKQDRALLLECRFANPFAEQRIQRVPVAYLLEVIVHGRDLFGTNLVRVWVVARVPRGVEFFLRPVTVAEVLQVPDPPYDVDHGPYVEKQRAGF
jgi:hypothetical protein